MPRKPKITMLPDPQLVEPIAPAPESPPSNTIPITELIKKDQQARVSRAAKAIDEILVAERVSLAVTSFNFVDGRLFPQLRVIATEPNAASVA